MIWLYLYIHLQASFGLYIAADMSGWDDFEHPKWQAIALVIAVPWAVMTTQILKGRKHD